MIAHLSGKVLHRLPDSLIVQVGGVGYRVFCPASALKEYRPDREVEIFTHLHVREDEMTLYGFEKLSQLNLFRDLLSISGIGPRLAMGIIDRGDPDAVVQAITRGDLSFFTAVPGVGKKNAARIVLELKGRLTSEMMSRLSADGQDDVVEALRSLGFAKREIVPVLQKLKPDLPVEERIKEALKHLSSR